MIVEKVAFEQTARNARFTEPVRLRLGVAYDGTAYNGWALQPDRPSVAAQLIRGLEMLLRKIDGFTVAGRTDAGVHATGQVVHVDVERSAWESMKDKLLWRLRGILPPDIRVTSAVEVDPVFNARFSAEWRRYVYRVGDDKWGVNPLRRSDTLPWPRRLNVELMDEAVQPLVGMHDFVGFCKSREGATTVRKILDYHWARDEDGIAVATVRADAFCHSMVRSLVGAALAVGDGRRDAAWLAKIVNYEARATDIHVVPPNGLSLVEVHYSDDPARWAERINTTRQMRTLEK